MGGAAALALMGEAGPFAIIVSDTRMPGMDGVELLSQVKEQFPDTTRVMLTGNADQATAMEAVNRGAIFRFLTKPCDSELLVQTLEAGIRQYELVTAEMQLLDQTLKGTLEMLVELLSLLDPRSFGRTQTRPHWLKASPGIWPWRPHGHWESLPSSVRSASSLFRIPWYPPEHA
jgi:CheY-like chemotaxis protein